MKRDYDFVKKQIGQTPESWSASHELIVMVELVETLKAIEKKLPDPNKPGKYRRTPGMLPPP